MADNSGVGDSGAQETRRRALHPAWQGLLAFIIYLAVFICAFCLALIGHLNAPQVGQGEVDPQFYIWAWRWWTYAVSHWTNPLFSYQIGAPGGYNLAWATTCPTVALLMWPITTTLGPLVSFNLTLVLAPPAAAWAAFVLARRLTGRFWAALPAGAVFGFNVYMLDHEVSGLPNLTMTMMLPLIAWLVVLWWDGKLRAVGYVIWMSIAIALEFYTFVEAYAGMTVLWALALLLGLAVARRGTRLRIVRLAGLTIIAYVGAALLSAPYLDYALKHYPTALTRSQPYFSLDLAGLIFPRSDRLLGITWWAPSAGHDISATSYLGFPLLLVLLGVAVFRWSSPLVRLLLFGFVVILALAAGPNLIYDGKQLFALPWGALWSAPVFRSAEPIRLIDFGYLLLSVALAMWLAALPKSKVLAAARWFLGLLALAAIFADLPTFAEVVVPPVPRTWVPALYGDGPVNAIPPFFADGAYKQYLRPGETVVIISHRGNAGMLFQSYTNFYFTIVGGFINASLSAVDAIPVAVEEMSYPNKWREQNFEAYIRAANVGAVIVEQAWSEKWMYNFDDVGLQAVSVGGVTIYQTGAMKPIGAYFPPLFPGVYPSRAIVAATATRPVTGPTSGLWWELSRPSVLRR